MDFKISETNKVKKSLIHDSYVFRIDNVLNSSDTSWRCSNRSWKARLRTGSAMSAIIPVRGLSQNVVDFLYYKKTIRSIANKLY